MMERVTTYKTHPGGFRGPSALHPIPQKLEVGWMKNMRKGKFCYLISFSSKSVYKGLKNVSCNTYKDYKNICQCPLPL